MAAATAEVQGQQNRMSSSPSKSHLIQTLFLAPFAEKKSAVFLIIGALLLLSLSQGLLLLLIGPFFKAMFADASQSHIEVLSLVPQSLHHLFGFLEGVQLSRLRLAQILPGSILLVGALKGIATYTFQLQQQVLALHLGRRYREKLFAAVIALPYGRLVQRSAGEWMSIIMNDVHFLQARISDLMTGFVRDGSIVTASLLALYIIHWPTALVITVLAIPLTISTGRTGRRIAHFAEGWQLELARMAGAVLDLRRRFEFIRAQLGEELEKKRFWAINQAYYKTIRRSIWMRAMFAPVLEWIGFAGFALILVLVRDGRLSQGIQADELLQFFAVLGILIRPLKSIGEQLSRYHETKGILRQSLRTFSEVESGAASQLPARPRGRGAESFRIEALALSHRSQFSLRAQDLEIRPGVSVAIIGPSGGGKSSMLKAFSGLLPPDLWQANAPWELLRQESSLVSQKPFLFSASIRENLVYGLSDAQPSDQELREVLDFVGLSSELLAMGQSLDTSIDFIQTPLSGGQLQRLTIARALLRPHAYLLMDEVTSAIDPIAEAQLTRRLIERAHSRSQGLLFVTHRMSQLRLFDEVWFCEAGQVQVFRQGANFAEDPRIARFLQEHQA